jgi:UDP-N-acetyl-D-glucosamine dehydrogenase
VCAGSGGFTRLPFSCEGEISTVNRSVGLQRRISRCKARIAVIGVSYVGLPLAVRLAETGFDVIGADKSEQKIVPLLDGRSTVEGIADKRVKAMVSSGKLTPLHVFYQADAPREVDPSIVEKLVGVDVFVVCVHTPLHKDRGWEPDPRWIISARELIDAVCKAEEYSNRLPNERLIILESTTYPKTTRTIFDQLLIDYSHKHGLSWYLSYSPERTDPGPNAHVVGKKNSKHRSTSQIPRIVAGLDLPSRDIACALYKKVFDKVEPVASLETAEMIKLVENAFRFVSIGFANELGPLARSLGLNIWEIVSAAKTKGFGLDLCYPGLIGGHCIPIDPHYLASSARNQRRHATFIDVAERAHQDTRFEAVDLIHRSLNQRNKGILGSRILFFGVAYKKDVADFRESPALLLMKQLFRYGAELYFWDPLLRSYTSKNPLHLAFSEEERKAIPEALLPQLKPLTGHSEKYLYYQLNALNGEWTELRQQITGDFFDSIVLCTDHTDFQSSYEDLILTESSPPLADLRNAIDPWLVGSDLADHDIELLKEKIAQRRNYMLLLVH